MLYIIFFVLNDVQKKTHPCLSNISRQSQEKSQPNSKDQETHFDMLTSEGIDKEWLPQVDHDRISIFI